MGFDAWYANKNLVLDEIYGELIKENKFNGYINTAPKVKAVPYEKVDVYAGNDRTIRILVRDPQLNVVNLTGATANMTWKNSATDTTAALSLDGTIGAADEGEVFFYVTPADTNSMTIRQYVFDAQVTLSNGKVYTVLTGVINLLRRVT